MSQGVAKADWGRRLSRLWGTPEMEGSRLDPRPSRGEGLEGLFQSPGIYHVTRPSVSSLVIRTLSHRCNSLEAPSGKTLPANIRDRVVMSRER